MRLHKHTRTHAHAHSFVSVYLSVRTHLHITRQSRVPLRMGSQLRLRGAQRTDNRRCGAPDAGVIALSIGAINIYVAE